VNQSPDDINAQSDRHESSLIVGQVVAIRADPARTGPVVAELEPVGGRRRFRVYHSPTVIRDYFEDQLRPAASPAAHDVWTKRLSDRRFIGTTEFRARLTATRLSNPQVDHIYALRSARIQFIPFQFKPLLRLLRADRPRLLIADDVGVGKTIEAGLILKELATRQQLDRVLVLCPKALTVKWRAEMRRFDEDFRILTPELLRYCLDETDLDGEWPLEYSRAIVHYELFRMEQYLVGTDERRRRHRGLLELEPPPQFNLVIADEAHHLRTPGTGSHRLIEHLCFNAVAILMLSATPVQIHADNLFTLLHLLRPELFPDKTVFQEVVEPNRYLSAAVRLLRAGPAAVDDWLEKTAEAIVDAGQTPWGRAVLSPDPMYQDVVERLKNTDLNDTARVRTIRDIEEMHSLAHVMNRTRRRDIGRFTVREPRTVSVPFTDEQRLLYDAVLAFRSEVLLQDYDPQVVRLILDMLERQAASCINALGPTIDRILQAGGVLPTNVTDDPEAEAPLEPVPGLILERARALLIAAGELPNEDPKFDKLADILSQTMADDTSPGKVLVFSFFLHTISYLRERLEQAGVRVGVVTGQVEDEEREALRDRFRLGRSDSAAIDVLLSSEVGCEGLDYEFCDRLVNYDIPWNPMRVEQRIGRIDRFGQRSEKVLIYNFITPDTVEERVFFRCFDRLGVFRDTVGDLEEVLGELVQELNRVALDPSLSPAQAEARARQLADNAIRLAEEQRRLDTVSGDLLGLDDAFTSEVGEIVEGGRFISVHDLRDLVETFLAQPFLRASLSGSGAILQLRLTEDGRRELASRIRDLGQAGHTTAGFLRALESGERTAVTFDQEAALEHRNIDFVTPVHPLARAAAAHFEAETEPLVGAFMVHTNDVKPGVYVFSSEIWETIAARPDLSLVCLAVSYEDAEFNEKLSSQLVNLFREAHQVAPSASTASPETLADHLHRLDSLSDVRRRQATRALKDSNEVLLNRRLASLQSFHDSRHRRVREELEGAAEARIIRMKTSELARIEADYTRRRAALERAGDVEILSRRVAAGIVEVADAR